MTSIQLSQPRMFWLVWFCFYGSNANFIAGTLNFACDRTNSFLRTYTLGLAPIRLPCKKPKGIPCGKGCIDLHEMIICSQSSPTNCNVTTYSDGSKNMCVVSHATNSTIYRLKGNNADEAEFDQSCSEWKSEGVQKETHAMPADSILCWYRKEMSNVADTMAGCDWKGQCRAPRFKLHTSCSTGTYGICSCASDLYPFSCEDHGGCGYSTGSGCESQTVMMVLVVILLALL